MSPPPTQPPTLLLLHLQSSLGQVKTTATDNVNVTVKMTTNGQGKKRACERHSFDVQCLRGTDLWLLGGGSGCSLCQKMPVKLKNKISSFSRLKAVI